jgi:hypothetical protein
MDSRERIGAYDTLQKRKVQQCSPWGRCFGPSRRAAAYFALRILPIRSAFTSPFSRFRRYFCGDLIETWCD